MAKKKTPKKKAAKSGDETAAKNPADHLKEFRFQPGQSGNPNGRPPLPPELKAIKELTSLEIKRIFAKYARMPLSDIKHAINDESLPAIESIVASILLYGRKKGDAHRLNFVLDRTIGKVSEKVDVELPKPFVIKSLSGETLELGAKREDSDE